jgi:Flavodoxin
MREPVDRIHQCPRCELRFKFHTELADHMRADHPVPLDDDTRSLGPARALRALVVFESMFGNTRTIAEAVAAGLAHGATVELVEVGAAPAALDPDVDLLVVGGPTHAFGLSRPSTREEAASMQPTPLVSTGPGLREWLDDLDCRSARAQVAAFDTHVRHVPGSAARAADRRLRHHGLRGAAHPVSFYVTGKEGPLDSGERERAAQWGAKLAALVAASADHTPTV